MHGHPILIQICLCQLILFNWDCSLLNETCQTQKTQSRIKVWIPEVKGRTHVKCLMQEAAHSIEEKDFQKRLDTHWW